MHTEVSGTDSSSGMLFCTEFKDVRGVHVGDIIVREY